MSQDSQERRRTRSRRRSQKHHRWKPEPQPQPHQQQQQQQQEQQRLNGARIAADHWRSTQPILSPPLSCASHSRLTQFSNQKPQLQKPQQQPPQELQHHT
ncbi:hypothetical protein M5D96_003924 [Drosophila gunungcola]|uniref:Uncharacterized protein n=1 Tax=Drosophila gunungcola TaxID=103775 RepID=A0A9P9YT58_9MUSC|nr:hypothetical protein M5D96_003924 [Drosophila gunungcola]